jgi:membrane-bound inhibitor of C-type lysozyme
MRHRSTTGGIALLAVFATAPAAAAAPTAGQEAPKPQISVTGGASQAVRYDCGQGKGRTVTYINGDPDHLAVVPVDGAKRIFVNVISASGARYASGQYIWWTKGREAWLYDVMHGPNAAPVLTCRERGL